MTTLTEVICNMCCHTKAKANNDTRNETWAQKHGLTVSHPSYNVAGTVELVALSFIVHAEFRVWVL